MIILKNSCTRSLKQIKKPTGLTWLGISAVVASLAFPITAHAVSGTAFRDGNGNGVKDAGELGIPGVVVKAFSNGTPEQLVGTETTGSTGTYDLSGLSGRLRLEFSLSDSGCNVDSGLDAPAGNASAYGSSVQFVDGNATDVNFGILHAAEYVTASNPTMFTTIFQSGNGETNSVSGNTPALFSYRYNGSGVPASIGGSAADPDTLLLQSQVGSTWGTAYSKKAKRLFLAAFLRRHSPMGPNGSGAIYMVDPELPPASATTPGFFSLDDLGIPTQEAGSYSPTHPGFHGVIGDNGEYGPNNDGRGATDRALGDDPWWPHTDASAFDQVGKVSLGGIDVSDDGQYLFVSNLYDRKLYRIDLQNPDSPVVPTTAQIHSYDNAPWLTQSCAGGVARPFALKFYRGKIYTGVVCTGENDSAAVDTATRAFVYELDPTGDGATGSIAVEFPLNYQRGMVGWTASQLSASKWHNWTGDWADLGVSETELTVHPQPMLSDIEFDSDGSMVLAFADRLGFQMGNSNATPDGAADGDGNLLANYGGLVGGDILRVHRNPTSCAYELEANGVAGPYTSTSSTAQDEIDNHGGFYHQGPGTPNGSGSSFTGYTSEGREFYYGEYAEIFGNIYPRETHGEGALGGVAIWPSSGEVIATGMAPVSQVQSAAGTYKLSNTTGARSSGYTLYHGDGSSAADAPQYQPTGIANYGSDSTTHAALGTANGIGDIEIIGEVAPMEIGNYIWLDTDRDGIQDADESGLENVTVQLLCGLNSATTTTDSNGEYFFSNTDGGNATFMVVGSACSLRVDTTQSALDSYKLSPANADGDTSNDLWTDVRDSDASLNGDNAEIDSFTIGVDGANNHGFDLGFIPAVLKVDKTVVGDAASANWEFTLTSSNCTLPAGLTNPAVSSGAGGEVSFINLRVNDGSSNACLYNISENLQTGYSLNVANSDTLTDISLDAGEVTAVDIENHQDSLCEITPPVIEVSCDDNGTASDAADDTFSYTINTSGSGVGVSYDISGGDSRADLAYGSVQGGFGDFAIASGDLVLTLTDGDFASCTLSDVSVSAPASCLDSIPVVPPPETCDAGDGEFGGTVYRDYNENGTRDLLEPGLAGVTVTAFDADNNIVATAVSNALGAYVLAGVTDGTDYRVEFIDLPDHVQSGSQGSDSRSTVRFEKAGARCDIDLGVNNPAQYCQAVPEIATAIQINGDPLPDGSPSGQRDWFVVYDSDNSGQVGDADYPAPKTRVDGSLIGATWGIAYHRYQKQLLAGAFLKRHSGLGAEGTGAIYGIDPAHGDASLFLDVNGFPTSNGMPVVNTGADPRDPADPNNALPTALNDDSIDLDAFGLVGKVGLGDLDISDDGETLFAVNLHDRTLLEIPVGQDLTAPATLNSYDITAGLIDLYGDTCGLSGADYRPFALSVHDGRVYVGAVCSAETSQNTDDLHAYIISADASDLSSGFSKVYDLALDFERDRVSGKFSNGALANWRPWATIWADVWRGARWSLHPSPVLSDIAIDKDGSLMLGFFDRFGHQSGFENTPADTSGILTTGLAAGDTLRVCSVSGGYVLEGKPGCGNNGTGHVNYTVGEFYPNENMVFGDTMDDLQHGETSMGSLAVHLSQNVLHVPLMDPFEANSGGVAWWDSSSGAVLSEYELYSRGDSDDGGAFGKATGLGDVELLCDPSPVEVGNRVWLDSDEDGIQDPGEAGIDGVEVTLACGLDSATTTTSNGGEYYFNNDVDGAANALFMDFGENCTVSITAGQTPLAAYLLTAKDAEGDSSNSPQTDLRDSDATDNAGVAEIAFTVGNAGENNHTLDFGYKVSGLTDISLTKTVDKTTVRRGETLTYTLTATNQSEVDATGVEVTDLLPVGVSYVSHNFTEIFGDGVWEVGDLAAGASKVLNITVTVD